jgi:ADP-heptose:LPS heptosyltransferase
LKDVELALRRSILLLLKLFRGFRQRSNEQLQVILKDLLSSSTTILFLRQDRIGDAIISTPLLVAISKAYPKASIMMLLGKNNKAFTELLPISCETVVYTKDPRADRLMIGTLRKRGIDILIDLTDNASVTSSLLIQRIHPKVAIGIEKENAVMYDIVVPRLDRENVHIARRIAELLRPLGIDPDTVPLQPSLNIQRRDPIPGRVGLNVSAGSVSRYAPAETYAKIALGIIQEPSTKEVEVLSAPGDSEFAQRIVALANHPKIFKAQSTFSLSEFGAEVSTCEVLVTPDTSIVHLGAAVGVPMVVIYAPIPDGLQYWTPIGVPYEMMVQRPSLEALEPEPVLSLFRQLRLRLGDSARRS